MSDYDASYVALAEFLGCDLLTADALSHEPRRMVEVEPGQGQLAEQVMSRVRTFSAAFVRVGGPAGTVPRR